MTKRTYTTKSGDTYEWEETEEVVKAVQNLTKFAGNYEGPLYAPHPDLKNETKINTDTTDVGYIFRCAVQRSNQYFYEKDLDRQAREHTTVVLALQKGKQFWKELL